MNDPQITLDKAEAFVHSHLVELCQELVMFDASGVLPLLNNRQAKLSALRDILVELSPRQAHSLARHMVESAAVKEIAEHGTL